MNKPYKAEDFDATELTKVIANACNCAYADGYEQGARDMEHAKQIIVDTLLREIEQTKADAIDEFAHALKETFNNEFPSNYHCTQPYFTLDNVRVLVDVVAKEQK